MPTMGYFHESHLSLMRISRRQAVYTVVSLFVNPIQFAPGEDLEGYPRDPERDLDFPVEIVAGPTVREPDGLALSSRNLYLSKEERRRAPDLYRGLQAAARALAEPGAKLASAGQGENVSLRRSVEGITGAGCGTGKRVIAMSFSKLKRKSKRFDFFIVDTFFEQPKKVDSGGVIWQL